MNRIARGVAAMAAAMLGGTAASAACMVGDIADLKVTMQGMKPLTEARINGVDVRFTLDSGAFHSVISPGNARTLALRPVAVSARMHGINGDAAMSVVTVKSFGITGHDIPNVQFVVAGSDLGPAGIGVLGQNLLGIADVEYDLPHGIVRLMRPKGCEKVGMAYWAKDKPFSTLDMQQPDPVNRHTIGTVYLNGVKIRATFDTGAQGSILSMAAAARAGITPKTAGVAPAGYITGFGRDIVRTWIAPFDSFKVGDQEELRHGRIRFGALENDTDMLIGADFFISHRVYVANSQNRIYLTYEGGPVFNLETRHEDGAGAVIAAASPDAADTPATADELSRSGAVKAARNDRDGALADFDKAIALDPTRPAYWLQRADLLLGMGRRASAATDIDKALALAPDDVDAHLLRARLVVAENGPGAAGVAADLDAADHAAPPASDQRLALGELYVAAGLAPRAVPQFDLWLHNHPDDVRRPEALNGRCWAKGLGNVDLPGALSDCNSAIRQRPGATAFVDSRALVELRMGQFDKAIKDYDAVLAAAPRPWALYGRGIAKLRSGDGSGRADVDAALKKAPRLIERARIYGLTA